MKRYFAIWGCHQINQEKYDRGLWVFDESSHFKVADGRQKITEALLDMHLENETGIWDQMIINQNTPVYKLDMQCKDDKFHQFCTEHQQLDDDRTKQKQNNFLVFIFLVVVVGIIAIITMGVCILNFRS